MEEVGLCFCLFFAGMVHGCSGADAYMAVNWEPLMYEFDNCFALLWGDKTVLHVEHGKIATHTTHFMCQLSLCSVSQVLTFSMFSCFLFHFPHNCALGTLAHCPMGPRPI